MSRTRASARAAGTAFETLIARHLAQRLQDDRVERRARNGAKDRGDIAGVRVHGQRLVLECKNTARVDLAGWVGQAETERGNDDALAGVVIHKRRGVTDPGRQYVTMTVAELLAIITGQRDDDDD